MERKSHLDTLAIVTLLVLCLSWGGQQVAIKLTMPDISPVMQAAIRSIGSTILIALWMLSRGQAIFGRDGTLWWGLAAGLLFAIEFLLIYWGLDFTHASRAVIFVYMSPFVVAIGTQWFVPGERLRAPQVAGLVLAFAGIVLAFGESFTLPSRRMLIGDSMLILAAVFWGATTVVIKAGPLAHASAAKTLLYQLGVSAVVLPVGSLLLGEAGIVRLSSLALSSLVYQTVWVAAITYLAWFWLIRHYPAPKLASFTFLTPIFGVLAGWLVLDEPLTSMLLAALVLVAAGIYFVNRPEKKA
ncbi:MAG: DMT family transporter [Gammaproteobacteria bacterium]|nr:DMT family transporter [Gammaproteobacteria bacterium]MDH4256569.1 DMT family transporter [Gammaproteobacteria bacterium]MDH5311212.1 DMT family transporter [Gammaproteobacteria bacterium]